MKLLFDQNVSPRLVTRLADLYPGAAHVQQFGLDTVADADVLDFAAGHGFILVRTLIHATSGRCADAG